MPVTTGPKLSVGAVGVSCGCGAARARARGGRVVGDA